MLKRVNFSEWASLIVAVPKKDEQFCVCGDYKATINPSLGVDQYPLPNPEDLFVSLTGGKEFTFLDLTSAYQQMLLSEEPKQFIPCRIVSIVR